MSEFSTMACFVSVSPVDWLTMVWPDTWEPMCSRKGTLKVKTVQLVNVSLTSVGFFYNNCL